MTPRPATSDLPPSQTTPDLTPMISALGCLAHLGALTALTVLVDRTTGTSVPPELRPWVPLVTATFLTFGLSNIWTLARGYGQGGSSRRVLLQRAHAGQPPPWDGPILATGRVRAEGPPLVSPVSGRPCVAYLYRVYERYLIANAQWETRVFYWGYACRRLGSTPVHHRQDSQGTR